MYDCLSEMSQVNIFADLVQVASDTADETMVILAWVITLLPSEPRHSTGMCGRNSR